MTIRYFGDIVKIFTIEEANGIVPYVEKMLENAQELNAEIKQVSSDIENLVNIWGNDVSEKGHEDNEFYTEKVEKRKNLIEELSTIVDTIHNTGCIIKDIDSGVIDFYHECGGEIVLLCWKTGEKKIEYWHTINSDYSARHPLSLLPKNKGIF